VGDRETTHFHDACGARQIVPAVRPAHKDTPYDLASLTKVLATTTAVLLLRDEGALDLDGPVSHYLPIPAFSRFTLRHCLTNTAGLVAGMPYYKESASINEMLQRCSALDLSWPPGTHRRYSDVGFMILGKVVELAARDSLDAFCAKRIYAPLQMRHTAFNPPKAWADACAATENCPWRKKVMVGKVHDENAYAVGGVAGHAGLFSTAEDIARFCRALVSGKLLSEKSVVEMSRLGQVPFYPWQGLGWRLDPWAGAGEGFLPVRTAIGHTGWTGTSLWIDLDRGLFVILLANTCHPSRDKRDTETLRRVFHAAVAREFYPNRSNTHSGLDRLLHENFEPVRGKRLGLLTNQAAVDQLNRPILDVLALDPAVNVRVVFSPEHGFSARAEAGEHVSSETGKGSAPPIISLYGKQKKPTAEQLKNVDLFVIDLQDVGSRYYTYMATMRDCLEVCAEAGKPVLVLDRPNPTGGEVLEGPIATETKSLTCCAAVPARHGMTMGELALFFRKTMPGGERLKLTVSQLDAWPRRLLFTQCALPWVPPSPNIPTPETALLYAGMCLFESANLNEGRGTETPFYVVGAPWLDAQAVIANVAPEDHAGCSLEPIAYTPRSIPGKASDPVYRDKPCKGIRIKVQDPVKLRPFRLAVALVCALRRRHPDALTVTRGLDTLSGGPDLRRRIESGAAPRDIIAAYEPALAAFDAARPKLYKDDDPGH
jgi:uncharacterized protein YbbC (DUF1343 family)